MAADGTDAGVSLMDICDGLATREQLAIMAYERLHQRFLAMPAGTDFYGSRLFELTTTGARNHRRGWL